MPTAKSNKNTAAKASAVKDTWNVSFGECDENIDAQDKSLCCDICTQVYHPNCVGLDDNTFQIFIDIRDVTGWVCRTCRADATSKFIKLQAAQTSLAEEVAEIKSSVNKLNASSLMPITADMSSTSYAEALKSSVVKVELHREMRSVIRDTERRGRNIIISGLDPSQSISDEEIVANLFEDNMSLKPFLASGCCKRIGKPVQDQPLKLRVMLASTEIVDQVLRSCKDLRKSTYAKTASSVYINKDLSPEESKAAYELRVKRRTERQTSSSSGGAPQSAGRATNMTATSATSSVAPQSANASASSSSARPASSAN